MSTAINDAVSIAIASAAHELTGNSAELVHYSRWSAVPPGKPAKRRGLIRSAFSSEIWDNSMVIMTRIRASTPGSATK